MTSSSGFWSFRRSPYESDLARYLRCLRRALATVEEAVLIADPSDGRILWCNEAVGEVFGHSPHELTGRTTESLHVDRESFRELAERTEPALETGSTFCGDFRMRRKDGTIFLSRHTITLVEESKGSCGGVVSVVRDLSSSHGAKRNALRDVTEQRLTEEAMERHRERLRFADKMESLGRLAGGIVHDIRNWIFLVMAHAELLEERVQPSEKRFVHEIQNATELATILVQQLAIFSHKSSSQPEKLDLTAVLQQMEPTLARIAGKGVALTLHGPQEPLVALLDRSQIQQVILNLVNNAVDAMAGHGALRFELRRVEPGPDGPEGRSGSYARLIVEDTGPGIDEEIRQRIFEPFFSTKESGTGLGLATVLAFVHAVEGTVELTSEPGEGARFELLLPLDP